MHANLKNFTTSELEATHIRGAEWAVRPKGQIGTIGWSPKPWQAVVTKAPTSRQAIERVSRMSSGVLGTLS